MTHLEIIKDAYDRCGIQYVIRSKTGDHSGYSYLFLFGVEREKKRLEDSNLDFLCRTKNYIEFENGEIASY